MWRSRALPVPRLICTAEGFLRFVLRYDAHRVSRYRLPENPVRLLRLRGGGTIRSCGSGGGMAQKKAPTRI